jgi:hypothetical protein
MTLDPAWRLATKKTPIAWFTGTNDGFYLLPAVMETFKLAAGPTHMTLVPNWDHALPAQISDDWVYAWLDAHLRGTASFAKVSPIIVRNEGGRLIATWEYEGEAVAADLIASYGDAGNWRGRYWHTFKAAIAEHTCRAELPAATLPCYVSGAVVNRIGLRSSTPLVRADATELGINARNPTPDYDGCSEWGGFEEGQIAFLTRHDRSGQSRWIPRLSEAAKQGRQSAILEPGRTVLPPILSTANVPHRFTCFMMADKPTTAAVDLGDKHEDFPIATGWTEIAMNLTPTNTLMGGIPASVTIPPDAKVLIDAVGFRPLRTSVGAH